MINRVTTLEETPLPQHRFEFYARRAESDAAAREGWGQRIGQFLGEHPILALSAGAVAGIALGCLVKRR